jgi:hypothetical protein
MVNEIVKVTFGMFGYMSVILGGKVQFKLSHQPLSLYNEIVKQTILRLREKVCRTFSAQV